ncbi:MAG TPA: cytochrome c3 family protein [Armatimonadota bacterium]|nr:cytochrome c3 family protein [Armatimonadota bacterium]
MSFGRLALARLRGACNGLLAAGSLLALLVLSASTVWSAPGKRLPVSLRGPQDNSVCLGCHNQVASRMYARSVHRDRACTDCHADVTTIPHAQVEPVRCGRCHPEKDAPVAVKPGSTRFPEGIHAHARAAGRSDAPDCADCHGSHEILRPGNPGATVNRANIPETCGRCHAAELRAYKKSTHWEAVARGEQDAAVCTDCHGAHSDLLPASDPRAKTNPLRVAATCNGCHDSPRIIEHYGLPEGRGATYAESYHGIAIAHGDAKAATCASCHGAHDIQPSTHPNSRVNREHLAATCSGCHKGTPANVARGTIHLKPSRQQDAPVYWLRILYRLFVFVVMAQFVALIGLDLLARRRENRHSGGAL